MPIQMVRAAPPVATIVYDATTNPLPPNMPSLGYQATQTAEFGDYIHLAGTNRALKTVTVSMSDWALYADYSSDLRYMGDSVNWTHPITVNVYSNHLDVNGVPDTLLGTMTQVSTIPWRPADDPVNCPGDSAWFSGGVCYHGYAFNLTFDMSSLNITLPDDIIVSVAYNTQTWGTAPLGVVGPYTSLNVGVLGTATVGTDDNVDNVFWNTSTAGNYADLGAAGVGIFREDTNWTPNGTVNIQITAAQSAGGDTVGTFRPSNATFYLRNSNTDGAPDITVQFGAPGDYPVMGDWDGNGTDTIGVYRNGVFYLSNSNTTGHVDLTFAFGKAGDQPIAGDWNGDGIDTIGIYRSSKITFLLRNTNSAGAADATFKLGIIGDVGIAGDWNADGKDSTGVFRPKNGALYFKNANTTGYADIVTVYGIKNDKPVVGDWDSDGDATIGIYRSAQFYLRNTNTKGYADFHVLFGANGDMPLSGNWDGIP